MKPNQEKKDLCNKEETLTEDNFKFICFYHNNFFKEEYSQKPMTKECYRLKVFIKDNKDCCWTNVYLEYKSGNLEITQKDSPINKTLELKLEKIDSKENE